MFAPLFAPLINLLNGEDDEQGLTFTAMESFIHGSFSLERNTGMLTYSPNSDYFGPDSMTYLLMDDGTTFIDFRT